MCRILFKKDYILLLLFVIHTYEPEDYVCAETDSPIGVKYNNTESLRVELLTGAFFQFSVPIWRSVLQNVLASHLKSKINVSQTLHMLLFLEFLKLLNQNTKPGPQKQNL